MADQFQSREERRKKLQAKGKQKAKKKPASIIKKILLILVALGIIGVLTGIGTFAFLVKDAPELDPKLLKDPISSKLLDKNGELITEVGAANREYVNYKDIPKLVENAILAVEDVRFYKHHGLDPIRLAGAVIANFREGFGSEGASTITQQVVKNSFLTPEKTIKRKVEEAWLSYQLEQEYTKHQIFEMYVNKVYVSENSHGIATAAKIYYGKELKDLTLPEAAQLAGMPQSPNNYNPFDFPEKAEKRRNIVLMLMEQHGFISKEDKEAAQSVPVTATLLKEDERKRDGTPFESFVDAVIDEVQEQGELDIFSDGLTIYTTLDPNAQTQVNKVLDTDEFINYPDEEFQAGVVLLDTKTGEIRAIGGGRNQEVKRGFNYAIDTKRQPGSTIKPVLDYGPAIEYLQWGTYQTISDKPITYSTGEKPGNYDNKFMGPMSMRTALALSRNTTAIQALQAVGLDKAKEFAVNLGIPLKEIYESYAIGGFREGVSPLEMAGAYSAFGNKGFYTKPHSVSKIKLRDGTIIDTAPEPKIVMKDYTAFMVTDMLKSVMVPPGTGRRASIPGVPLAGKTGTTNYSAADREKWDIKSSSSAPDVWFAGYSTNYTAAVWTGYKDLSTPVVANDQNIAQYIFKSIMEHVSKDIENPDFTVPDSVERVRIEKGSMPPVLAGEFTPKSEVITEYAVKGHAPKTVSAKYDKLDTPTDLKATYDPATNEITLSWNYKNANNLDVEFVITNNDGSETKTFTTTETNLKIPANPGASLTLTLLAKVGEKTSDSIKTSLQVPNPAKEEEGQGAEEEKPNEGDEEEEENEDGTGGEFPPGTLPGTPGNVPGNNGNGNGGTNSGSRNN
ncbi:PBP1A family penicillin-binding protein [Neobacillus sp. FSL H8-0543]|uniref:transglycosylase domain-containing protein n=1 Tax=Neobacillus sp. FSL H8-0543 TaxID=2954672 RepID=UPI003158E601